MNDLDWQAISAIATTGAVFVALWPIVLARIERRRLARSLRAQILAQVAATKSMLKAMVPSSAVVLADEGDPYDEAQVRTIEEIFRQADSLRADEQALLLPIVSDLKSLKTVERAERRESLVLRTIGRLDTLEKIVRARHEGRVRGFRRKRLKDK
jgi:hypothetical protein